MAHRLSDIGGLFRKDRSLEILTHPNPTLYQLSEPVDTTGDPELAGLISGLKAAMKTYDGVGMAASQAGVLKRLFVYDISEGSNDPHVLINPVITAYSSEVATADEGCLSFPHIYFPVTRPARITVEALDEQGQPVVLADLEGLLARVVQHECDHLDGIMIIDRAEPHIRKKALRAYATYDQQSEESITITDEE